MDEKVFVGYSYGSFETDDKRQQEYCNVFMLEDFTGEQNDRYHFLGQKAVKYKWCPVWDWTFTFIPHWANMFDSRAIPDMPYLVYSEVEPPEMDDLPDPDDVPASPRKAMDKLRRIFRRN